MKAQKPEQSSKTEGEFIRWDSAFRHWITPDGSPGPTGDGGFRAEPDRYHLYVSYACPWAHRTLIFRALKDLEKFITVDVVHPLMGAESWHFGEYPGATPDRMFNSALLRDVYRRANATFDGVVTVPVLWDRHTNTIVNNESSEIIRMFNSAFDHLTGNTIDYYPAALQTEVDTLNQRIYDTVNNGVYRAGFARSQRAYEQAYCQLFDTLDYLEAHLQHRQWLLGDTLTEADWRLYPTLVRFDAVYHGHFKCNRQRLVEFPNLWRYTRQLHAVPGIASLTNFRHIKYHYYGSHKSLNPTGIVPVGPVLDFSV